MREIKKEYVWVCDVGFRRILCVVGEESITRLLTTKERTPDAAARFGAMVDTENARSPSAYYKKEERMWKLATVHSHGNVRGAGM